MFGNLLVQRDLMQPTILEGCLLVTLPFGDLAAR